MTKEELQYYSRQIILSEIGLDGQQRLKETSVLVIGAGGLGCPVLQHLSAAGIGRLGIVDFDKISASNLHRQTIYKYSDIGAWKCDVAKSFILALNPFIVTDAFRMIADENNILDLVTEYDIIVDCTDNPLSKYLINDACVCKSKPLVYGSVFKFEGNISVFNLNNNAPTLRCLFPEPNDEVPDCERTGVLGITTALTGIYMANEALKIALGISNILTGKLLVINTLNSKSDIIDFNPNLQSRFISLHKFNSKSATKSVSPENLKDMMDNKEDFQLIDVRTEQEHEAGNIGGTLIPLDELEENIYKIDTRKRVVVYCQHGVRSHHAAEFLRETGYKNILTLEGGIHNWLLNFALI